MWFSHKLLKHGSGYKSCLTMENIKRCLQDEVLPLSPWKYWRFTSIRVLIWSEEQSLHKQRICWRQKCWATSEIDKLKFIWLCVIRITLNTLGLNRRTLFPIHHTCTTHTHTHTWTGNESTSLFISNISAIMCVCEIDAENEGRVWVLIRACASCPQKTTPRSANCKPSLTSHKRTPPRHSSSVKSHYAQPMN